MGRGQYGTSRRHKAAGFGAGAGLSTQHAAGVSLSFLVQRQPFRQPPPNHAECSYRTLGANTSPAQEDRNFGLVLISRISGSAPTVGIGRVAGLLLAGLLEAEAVAVARRVYT
eukprot:COSAG02_NODE_24726_length_679_cov_1.079310_1_plen_113_part_00